MKHIITIPKRDYSKYKVDALLLALAILTETDYDGIAMDSSGDYYKLDSLTDSTRRAEQLKYFSIGFLQAFELE